MCASITCLANACYSQKLLFLNVLMRLSRRIQATDSLRSIGQEMFLPPRLTKYTYCLLLVQFRTTTIKIKLSPSAWKRYICTIISSHVLHGPGHRMIDIENLYFPFSSATETSATGLFVYSLEPLSSVIFR